MESAPGAKNDADVTESFGLTKEQMEMEVIPEDTDDTPEPLPDYKRRTLEKRLALLLEEYEAVNAQISTVLSPIDRIRLQRQAEAVEKEIEDVRTLLAVEIGGYRLEVRKARKPECRSEQPAPGGEPEDSYTFLRLQLLQPQPGRMQVRGLDVPGGGQPKAEVDLPYSLGDLPAVLKALDVGQYVERRFKAEYKEALERLGLLSAGRLHPDFHAIVGRRLYNALFSGEILTELKMAERAGKPVACQICFDPEDVILAQFPWELMHDNRSYRVPPKQGVELTRYITFGDPPAPLKTALPLKLLLVRPRPTQDDPLEDQTPALLEGLESLQTAGKLTWKRLEPPIWPALEDCLNNEAFDIVHFDGHGSFVRECPACGELHYPSTTTCAKCEVDMSQATPQGYLDFEKQGRHRDPIKVDEMQVLLSGSNVRLVFLSACSTGVVKGASIFNGIGPALIQVGIPAVLAMQASPPDKSNVKFVKRFYESLAKGRRVPQAANDGRRAIYRPLEGEPISWFMPVVYLRSSDETCGRLFDLNA